MPEPKEEKTRDYVNVGHSVEENLARSQKQELEAEIAKRTTVTRLISEFLWKNLFAFAGNYLRSRFGPKHDYPFYPNGDDNGIFPLEPSDAKTGEVSLALLGDWGSDTAESDAVSMLVARHRPAYTIHLGDIYFVGTDKEVYHNFTAAHASWYFAKKGSLALLGNHEMYSNGTAYFSELLPRMYASKNGANVSQKAPFFCLENEYWRIIGLDTGYTSVGKPFLEVLFPPDGHLRKEQLQWLEEVVRLSDANDHRGIVFLSHHPYLSAFGRGFPKPSEQLREILGAAHRPVIWFWGHEHRLVTYTKVNNPNQLMAFGRCVGHSGMPVDIDDADPEEARIDYYDRRLRKTIGRFRLGYNGFVKLNLNQSSLRAHYLDIEETLMLDEEWRIDLSNGQLTHQLHSARPELAFNP